DSLAGSHTADRDARGTRPRYHPPTSPPGHRSRRASRSAVVHPPQLHPAVARRLAMRASSRSDRVGLIPEQRVLVSGDQVTFLVADAGAGIDEMSDAESRSLLRTDPVHPLDGAQPIAESDMSLVLDIDSDVDQHTARQRNT